MRELIGRVERVQGQSGAVAQRDPEVTLKEDTRSDEFRHTGIHGTLHSLEYAQCSSSYAPSVSRLPICLLVRPFQLVEARQEQCENRRGVRRAVAPPDIDLRR